MERESFSSRLKKACNMKNITQAEISKKTGISSSLINKYFKGIAEAGNFNLSKIADVLNVNEAWLIGYDVSIEREITSSSEKKDYSSIDSVKKEINRLDNKDMNKNNKETLINMVDFYHEKTKKENKED